MRMFPLSLLIVGLILLPGVALAEKSEAAPRICIQPMGKVDRQLLGKAVTGIKYYYGYPVKVLPHVDMPAEAYYAPRKRHRAGKLLVFLEETVVVRDECDIAVGFTRQDISTSNGKIKDWGIFGLGSVGGSTCVISTYRLTRKQKSKRQVAIRTIKVVNHELGHVLGLGHCPKPGCMMNDAKGTIKTVDAEDGLLCPLCKAQVTMSFGSIPDRDKIDWDELVGDQAQ